MKCKDCKHWNRSKELGDNHYNLGLGKCDAIVAFWDATDWNEEGDGREFVRDAKDRLAFSQDGSDYSSRLYTRPAFGCVQFEPKT